MPYTPENLRALAWVRNGSKPSAPVDVLAVMDFRIDQAVSNWRYHGQDDGPEPDSIIVFRQARAAIAELIESAAVVVKPYRGDAYAGPDIERLEAALARVGGGK